MYHIQKYFAIALTMLLCLDLGAREKPTKETILNHAEELKALVNDRCWPGFSAPEYATHLNYHEDGDFRMYLSIDGRDAEAVIECSSPEITFAAQPGIKTLDQWYAMVLHECFHGFQVKHEVFRDMMMESLALLGEDFTNDYIFKLADDNDWYQTLLADETAFLKAAYASDNLKSVRRNIRKYLKARTLRFNRVKMLLGIDLEKYYGCVEAMDGGSRYVELFLYNESGDTDIEWLTDLESRYTYYSSGLVIMLMLDKWGVDFKSQLYSTGLLLPDLLKEI